MTAITTAELRPALPALPARPGPAVRYVRETALLVGRSLRSIPRVPERLSDVTIQPVIFTFLFLYVFGSAIHIPGMRYQDYLLPGLIGQGLAFGVIGAGVATSTDFASGVIDRFRSLPVTRLSVITAQVLGQMIEQVLAPAPERAEAVGAGRSDSARAVRLHVVRGAPRHARSKQRRHAGRRVRHRPPPGFSRRHVRAYRGHEGGAAGHRGVGPAVFARGSGAASVPGHSFERLLAARPPRPRHDRLVPADHCGVRPTGSPPVPQYDYRLRLLPLCRLAIEGRPHGGWRADIAKRSWAG